MTHSWHQSAQEVLRRFPYVTGRLLPLDHHDGFSGASIWKVETGREDYCLRAWPADGPAESRLAWIHNLMITARQGGLTMVPALMLTVDQGTWTWHDGRAWELSTWMPGRADPSPAVARIRNAATALAQLHQVWSRHAEPAGPCPAVQRRLAMAEEWLGRLKTGWKPRIQSNEDPALEWAIRAWQIVPAYLELITPRLAEWQSRPVAIQPCLCDVWRAHLLFIDDELTGLIDYGSAKIDNIACDLARMIGSLAGDDQALRAAGLDAYHAVRPLAWQEHALIDLLDHAGTVLAVVHWLQVLFAGEGDNARARFGQQHRLQASRRLAELVQRMENWRFGFNQ